MYCIDGYLCVGAILCVCLMEIFSYNICIICIDMYVYVSCWITLNIYKKICSINISITGKIDMISKIHPLRIKSGHGKSLYPRPPRHVEYVESSVPATPALWPAPHHLWPRGSRTPGLDLAHPSWRFGAAWPGDLFKGIIVVNTD